MMKTLSYLILFATATAAILFGALQLPQVQRPLLSYFFRQVAVTTGWTITVERASLSLLTVTVDGVEATDHADNTLSAKQVSATLSPLLFVHWVVPHWSVEEASYNDNTIGNFEGSLTYNPRKASGKLRIRGADIEGRFAIKQRTDGTRITMKLEYGQQYQVASKLTGSWASATFRGAISATTTNGQVDATLEIHDMALDLSAIRGHYGATIINGRAAIDAQGWHDTTHLFITQPAKQLEAEVQLHGTLIAPEISGRLSHPTIGTLELAATLSPHAAAIKMHSARLSNTAMTFVSPTLSATIEDPFTTTPHGEVTATAEAIIYNAFTLTSPAVIFKKEGDDDQWYYNGHGGADAEVLNFYGSASWDSESDTLTSTLESATFHDAGYRLRTTTPFAVTVSSETLSTSPIALTLNEEAINTDLHFDRGTITLKASSDAIPAPLLSPLLPSKVQSGTIAIDADLHGSVDKLGGTLHFTLAHLTFSDHSGLNGTVSLDCYGDSLAATAHLHDDQGHAFVNMTATLPAAVMLQTPIIAIDETGPYTLKAEATAPIGPILDLIAVDASSIHGDAKLNVTGHGTLDNPTIEGSVTLANGGYESYELGTVIEGLSAQLKAEGNQLLLTELSGHDGNGGILSGTGTLYLSPERPFALNVQLERFLLTQLDTLACRASGKLELTGNRNAAQLAGTLRSDQALLRLSSRGSGTLTNVNVTYINQPANQRPPTAAKPTQSRDYPIALQVELTIPTTLAIHNEELTSQWKGALVVAGTVKSPQVDGVITLKEGRYLLNGKAFELKEGNINFGGDLTQETSLFVVARREIQGYYVDIILKGAVSDPDIALGSSPPLSQQEVLSLVLFGKPPSDISTSQDEALEQSLSSLQSGRAGTLTKLEKSLYIDTIDISRGSNDSLRLQVGKYVTPNIFISVNTGLDNESRNVAAEVKLHHDLSFQVEADENAAGQLSLKWRKDY